ncbi:MAG: uracil phosphoribosyltransferase [Eubacteriales bacterium]|nr:uracil phosphoribosyltransferase [Eubacteriales bacterium]
MTQVHVMDHPLIIHKLSLMRDKCTGAKEFREAVSEISSLLCYEACSDLPMKEVEIETPVAHSRVNIISGRKIALVAILRSGIGMVEGALQLIPNAKVGHIGLYRDPKTMQPVEYYCKLPTDAAHSEVLLFDTMMATGNTVNAAIQSLKNHDVTNIKVLTILASQNAVDTILAENPDVQIYCGAIDEEVNEDGYIVPGMGDAGNRMYGTK